MPSQVAAQIGGWSPIAFVLMGLASMAVALCFAEVGSRFDSTGGPYLYTRAAFGRFVALRGRVDAVVHARAEPGERHGRHRASRSATTGRRSPAAGRARALLIGVTAALTWINVRGIRQSAWLVNALTIGKLLPLALFIVVGLSLRRAGPAHDAAADHPEPVLDRCAAADLRLRRLRRRPVPAGEALDPRRARAVRARRDDPRRDGGHDAGADRRAGRAAGSGAAQHADCRRGGGVPRRRPARCSSASAR